MGNATRRLAAILAADVAGYSRLVGADEEGTIEAFRSIKREQMDPAVKRHGGRIANTAGDSFLIEFPSVVDAVRCAVEIQRELADRSKKVPKDRRVQLRIGINLGDVIDEEGDLLGDGVNVAARIESLAEPGGILLSRAARDQVRDRLDIPLVDMGEVKAKNIARPIRIFSVGSGSHLPTRALRRLSGQAKRRWVMPVTLALLTVIAATTVGVWYLDQGESDLPAQSALSAGTSLAVLPFSNLSRNSDQDYFADGITSDLITDLSKFQNLFVIARNSAFLFKKQNADPISAGQKLGVRYVLKGSVQKHDARIRINIQLFDVESGKLLWGERYDEPSHNLFDIQDKITKAITRTLSVTLTRIELARALAKKTKDLQAYDLVLRAEQLMKSLKRADNFEAKKLFQDAIERDAKYGSAYAGLGRTYYEAVLHGWTEVPHRALETAKSLALKAIELDGNSVDGHDLLARIYLIRRNHQLALVESERAISINPNDAASHALQGTILVWSGRPQGAIRSLQTALRFDPFMGIKPQTHLAAAYYLTGQYQKAVTTLERAIRGNPEFAYAHTILAAAYGQLGRDAAAKRAVQAIRKLSPFFSTERFGGLFLRRADANSIIDGLRKAGLE